MGRLWTANQRVVDGPLEAVVGDDEVDVGAGGYDIGARARQIRDDLLALAHPATEADMLAIQLDARALFLARSRDLLLALVDEQGMRAAPRRRECRELVSQWKPEAVPDSVGYRLVRAFRGNAQDVLWRALESSFLKEKLVSKRPAQFEAAGWKLVSERPNSIKPPLGDNWRDFLLLQLDDTLAKLVEQCGTLIATTAAANQWPYATLCRAPCLALAPARHADTRTARRQPHAAVGWNRRCLERFAVSPGREQDGYLELPGVPPDTRCPLLSQWIRGLGSRTADTFSAWSGSASTHAPAGRPVVSSRP